MARQNRSDEKNKPLYFKRKIGGLIFLASAVLLISFVYGVVKGIMRAHYLKSRPVFIKAVIIDKRNYNPNESIPTGFSYSYRFLLDGKVYEGNALDKSLRVGDSVEVEYVRGVPSLNRAVHSKEW
jgi:hypothetical protein